MTLACPTAGGRCVHRAVVHKALLRLDRSAGAGSHLSWRPQAWISFSVQWEPNKVKIIVSECLLNPYGSWSLILVIWLWDTNYPLLSRMILFVCSKSPHCALFIQPGSSIFLASRWMQTSSQLCFRCVWQRAASRRRNHSASEG